MKNIVENAKTKINIAGFKLKNRSPEILAVVGTLGIITSTVMACRATTKLDSVLEESKNKVESIHHYIENPDELTQEYTEEDGTKDLAIVYAQTGFKIVKLYAPAAIVGALSVGAMLTSNNILRKRNIALAAAYTTVDKSFKEYRERVKERFGQNVEQELRHGVSKKEFERVRTDEDGNEVVEKETVDIVSLDGISEYAKFFDSGCPGWRKNAEYNLSYLRMQQEYANERLRATKHLFLNEVYDMLGILRTEAGQTVGWVYDDENPTYVDFGLYNTAIESNRDFINGYEPIILLDFNVSGVILPYLREGKYNPRCESFL